MQLEEAVAFIKENTKKLLSTECVTLYPVSSRCALEAKLSAPDVVENDNSQSMDDSLLKSASFFELEKYLYSFLDASTTTGIERMRLKLETPVRIAEQLLSSCQTLVSVECQQAKKDLMSVNEFINGVKDWKKKMESESISWKRQILSLVWLSFYINSYYPLFTFVVLSRHHFCFSHFLCFCLTSCLVKIQIDTTQASVFQLVDSTLRLSNLDLVAAYVFKGDKTSQTPATVTVRNDIIGPAALEAEVSELF